MNSTKELVEEENRELETPVYSLEVGVPWLNLLSLAKRSGNLEMFTHEDVTMGVGIGKVERTTEGTGDNGGNAGSSTASSSLTSGRTWEAEVRTMEPLLSVLPRPYFKWW